jgi:subtilisin family serine protease
MTFCFHLQPDISAPGMDILYAYIGAISATGLASDNRRIPYTIGSGTSVACPHVSAIVALLKTIYPHWTPAAFKSAIMTTGKLIEIMHYIT